MSACVLTGMLPDGDSPWKLPLQSFPWIPDAHPRESGKEER
jgi:hypothetical protein